MTTAFASTTHGTPATIRCPKCAGEMATYERSGILVDQCRDCRGMFLDRGELERLVDAEGGGWLGPASTAAAAPVAQPSHRVSGRDSGRSDENGYRSEWHDDDDWDARRVDASRSRAPKRQSILNTLLDSFGD